MANKRKQGVEWKLHFLWDNPTRHIVDRDGVAWSSHFCSVVTNDDPSAYDADRSMRKRGFGSMLDGGCCKFVGGGGGGGGECFLA